MCVWCVLDQMESRNTGFWKSWKAWVPVGKPLRTPPTYGCRHSWQHIGGGRCRNWRLSLAVTVFRKLSIDVILSDIANVFQIWSIVAACYERLAVGFKPTWKNYILNEQWWNLLLIAVANALSVIGSNCWSLQVFSFWIKKIQI